MLLPLCRSPGKASTAQLLGHSLRVDPQCHHQPRPSTCGDSAWHFIHRKTKCHVKKQCPRALTPKFSHYSPRPAVDGGTRLLHD